MNYTRLSILATVIVGIIIAVFLLSAPHTRDVKNTTLSTVKLVSVPSIYIKDAFRKGKHTITGSITMSTPCTSLLATANATGSASTTIGILLKINMPKDTGICLQQPLKTSFSTTVIAPKSATITITVNGAIATTTPL